MGLRSWSSALFNAAELNELGRSAVLGGLAGLGGLKGLRAEP